MNVKVSIVVPVYNCEKYLRQCLDSILNQSLKEIEIICINDGSTDNSPHILEKYALKDKRITVINQENKGIAASRNTGMGHTTGEYIGFVDSDDWIDKKMYENLYINAKSHNSDMVMCPAYVFDDISQEIQQDTPIYFSLERFDKKFDNKVFDHTKTKSFLFGVNVTCWNKIYKSEFIDEISAKFPEINFEDNIFFYETYINARRVSLIRDFLYYYRINRAGSFITEMDKNYYDICKMFDLLHDVLNETGNLEEYLEDLLNYQIKAIISFYSKVEEVHKPEFFAIIKQHFINNEFFNPSEIDLLYPINKTKYQHIINSDTYKEFELRGKISKLQIEKEKHSDKEKYQKLLVKHEDMLEDQKQKYEKKIQSQTNFIQELTTSNSWKLTKPLRKIRNIIKSIKSEKK